eukprot:13111685-Alexandrium_andersonii.AAC.1
MRTPATCRPLRCLARCGARRTHGSRHRGCEAGRHPRAGREQPRAVRHGALGSASDTRSPQPR